MDFLISSFSQVYLKSHLRAYSSTGQSCVSTNIIYVSHNLCCEISIVQKYTYDPNLFVTGQTREVTETEELKVGSKIDTKFFSTCRSGTMYFPVIWYVIGGIELWTCFPKDALSAMV